MAVSIKFCSRGGQATSPQNFMQSAIGTFTDVAKKSTIARSVKKPKFSTRIVRRCFMCGRKHGYMRKFGLCRIHFRELASEGLLPGIQKSSW